MKNIDEDDDTATGYYTAKFTCNSQWLVLIVVAAVADNDSVAADDTYDNDDDHYNADDSFQYTQIHNRSTMTDSSSSSSSSTVVVVVLVVVVVGLLWSIFMFIFISLYDITFCWSCTWNMLSILMKKNNKYKRELN